MKGVQCHELFGGIALKIHTFSFSSVKTIWILSYVSRLYGHPVCCKHSMTFFSGVLAINVNGIIN